MEDKEYRELLDAWLAEQKARAASDSDWITPGLQAEIRAATKKVLDKAVADGVIRRVRK